jgi:hypothetical protein
MIDTITIAAISFASGGLGAAIGYLTCKNMWSKHVEYWLSKYEAERIISKNYLFRLQEHQATRDRHNKAKRDKRAAGKVVC